jgi:hypothetical protein
VTTLPFVEGNLNAVIADICQAMILAVSPSPYFPKLRSLNIANSQHHSPPPYPHHRQDALSALYPHSLPRQRVPNPLQRNSPYHNIISMPKRSTEKQNTVPPLSCHANSTILMHSFAAGAQESLAAEG